MTSSGSTRIPIAVDRLIALGVVALVGVAACTATSDPDGGSETAPAAPVTIAAPPSTSATTTSTTTTTTTSTTLAPTTTIAPTVEVVDTICSSLRSDGFETRRVMVAALAEAFAAAGGEGDGRAEVGTECGPELDRLHRAVAIRDRVQAIDMAEEDDLFAMSLTDFSCGSGTFEVTVTNDWTTPLGLHANFAMFVDGDREDAVQSSFAPIVIWSLEPGASELVTGRFTDRPQAQVSCEFQAQVFEADPTDADVSLGTEPEYPALTGDDPAVWFPALFDVEREARTSGDIDIVAAFADVRSMGYDEAASAISDGEPFPGNEIVEVCERGRSQPDDDHIGFVYLKRLEAGQLELGHGLFRRGNDGQWRWLSNARYYEPFITKDCSGVDPQ
ncbi:MAG: hypothetical protein WA964_11305 [Ilumatobacter sp.]|uniref:hypothetical protein n=1 Tax=Ilumatobacter sp. TaxID=1967498 RepID=UPI003C7294AF